MSMSFTVSFPYSSPASFIISDRRDHAQHPVQRVVGHLVQRPRRFWKQLHFVSCRLPRQHVPHGALRKRVQRAANVDGDVVPRRHLVGHAVPIGRDVAIWAGDRNDRIGAPQSADRVRPNEVQISLRSVFVQQEGNVADKRAIRSAHRQNAETACAREREMIVLAAFAEGGVWVHIGPVDVGTARHSTSQTAGSRTNASEGAQMRPLPKFRFNAVATPGTAPKTGYALWSRARRRSSPFRLPPRRRIFRRMSASDRREHADRCDRR